MIESLYSEILNKAEKVFDISNEYPEMLSVCILPVTSDPIYFQAFVIYTAPENRDLNIGKYLNYPTWSKQYSNKIYEKAELYSEANTVEESLQDLLKHLNDLEEQKLSLKPKENYVWIIKDLRGKYYNKCILPSTPCFRWEESQKNAYKFSNLIETKNIAKSLPNPVKIVKLKTCK